MTIEELRSLWQSRDERYHERAIAPEVAEVIRRGRMQEAEVVLDDPRDVTAAHAELASWKLPQPETKYPRRW